ncbi:16S rRNA (guanine(966)-N(2))-methyltransferase RsmD [Clavibacter capsici]|uniref:16S rRNA (Guanine(966)-N(2))-methyltransferase RsmD n=1 Tax=Clavibacter capsici TaxID=1874630 RepID=A0AAE7CBL4_9MICO|nr:16S rRNA (guanine(966)-N(2))-methyltransferase RsmD [Clavibacter capsici]QIS44742.1 16S rRNA (guanine(966)-N(2))-methyltransferase RsmD [Clavibacter capsici]
MTRIVAGYAGSLVLRVPKSGTRPTSDRVREALFSGLEARDALDGARVLDLYAGSGALGLEAASRGAREVVLVERAVPAAAVCRSNAALVERAAPRGAAPRIRVAAQSVRAFLAGDRGSYDVAFLDPPYEVGDAELAEELAALVPRLVDGAVVMVERSSRSAEPAWPAGLVLDRRKSYGDTVVWWASAEAADADDDATTPAP